jgi:hypothetical protein
LIIWPKPVRASLRLGGWVASMRKPMPALMITHDGIVREHAETAAQRLE